MGGWVHVNDIEGAVTAPLQNISREHISPGGRAGPPATVGVLSASSAGCAPVPGGVAVVPRCGGAFTWRALTAALHGKGA